MSIGLLEELPNQDKSTDSQQAESSTVAGISIRDSKGKEYDTIHLVFDRYNLASSLKEATRERRQDGKTITDYYMEESTDVGKVTANSFCQVPAPNNELTDLPLGLIGFFDLLPALLVISPNMPRFLLTRLMSCTNFLSPNAFYIGFQHLSAWRSATECAPSYLTDHCRPVSDLAFRRALRSSFRGEFLVPRVRSALKQLRASPVIGTPNLE